MSRHVAVVGAGPAGLAAAAAALRAGARVTLLDAAEEPGGQYHRMLPAAFAATRPERLHHGWRGFDRMRRHVLGHPRCDWWPESAVWSLERSAPGDPRPPRVHALRGPADGGRRERHVLAPDALVLAPGAHDRVLPFPGWELPGVFTAGAAQALAKGERLAVGDDVVVAGTGPFLLPVAAALLDAGSRVAEVLEANPPATVLRGWAGRPWELAPHHGKAGELAAYGALLARHRVPYRLGRAVVEARGDGRVEEVVTARLRADWSVVPGTARTVAVDALCVSHGFTPQLELPVAAGCALRRVSAAESYVQVDGDQLTSVPRVYAAGEITGIAGAPAARAEGLLAGWLAAGGSPAAPESHRARLRRDQGRAFAARLAAAHPVGAGWPGWLRPDTVVCRCEETSYATLCDAAGDPAGGAARTVKLGTRAGLGPCQARVCGPTVAELLARRAAGTPGHPVEGLAPATPHHRPIAQPIRLGELAAPPHPPTQTPNQHEEENP
ncbi:FAD/NAD(P)-binding oxidoreductase [Actinomadura viridis]|uniref:NADPH-dependent 2,4-dienoyl-CoA reductase/sulfur reductase-like enzyme n=1 Tax=Actinomadura viridis TaxID=58110 RepID=A0A931DII8_9ACTN|nr:FAD-dependent oxidoreductase [Actinomadura viridis]MBG6089364.1 NADPH-dependent 2,4-dienoyl-CoA reductase/sulfur reductase-like enzyme [Actinomadura viridis]